MFNNSNVIIDKFNDFIDYIIKNRQNNTDYNILVIDYRKKTDIYCMSIRFETIQNLFSKEDMVHIHSISVRDIHFIERLDISKRPGE